MSDSNSGFELISSQPDPIPTYDSVPEDKVYKIKVLDTKGAPRKVAYKLRKGISLPYTTKSGG